MHFLGSWDTNAGHHSAIQGKDKQDYLNIEFIVNYYESKGAPRSKLVLGLANYGRSDSPAMPYTGFKGESGFVSYYESCLMLSCEKWKEFWNEAQNVPYAKGKDNYPWAGYDNVRSMKIKAEYIIAQKLGGAMFWVNSKELPIFFYLVLNFTSLTLKNAHNHKHN